VEAKKWMVGLTVLVFISMVAACGGGGGSSAPAMATGVFKDSNVSGMEYETSSGQSGFTDQQGRYTYVVGDSVTFFIGGVVVGTTTASGVVTPVDIVAGGSTSSPQVQNIVRFLMMLDSDGTPDNGISISADLQTVADSWSQIDFSDADLDTQVASIITDCQTADGGTHVLPNASAAQTHLESTMRCVYSGAFAGTFAGDDSGTYGIMIDPQTGRVRGAAYSPLYDETTEASGTGIVNYDQTMAFITGFVDTGATFNGQLSTPNAMSGTWSDAWEGDSGTFSGNRIGGTTGSSHRYSGVVYDEFGTTVAVLSMDVNGGTITGVGFSIEENEQFDFNGTLSGSTISAVAVDGTTIDGTLNSDDTFSGIWNTPAVGESGTFEGCGCQLN
jgi:hypothetical protein